MIPDESEPQAVATVTVQLHLNTRYARWWVSVVRHMAPVLVPLFGDERVVALGGLSRHVVRWRIDSGRWHWMGR